MKTLVTVSLVLDWPEDALHELAASLDAGVRKGMAESIGPVIMSHRLSAEDVDAIIDEHLEFYGVSLMPIQEVSFTGEKP